MIGHLSYLKLVWYAFSCEWLADVNTSLCLTHNKLVKAIGWCIADVVNRVLYGTTWCLKQSKQYQI